MAASMQPGMYTSQVHASIHPRRDRGHLQLVAVSQVNGAGVQGTYLADLGRPALLFSICMQTVLIRHALSAPVRAPAVPCGFHQAMMSHDPCDVACRAGFT